MKKKNMRFCAQNQPGAHQLQSLSVESGTVCTLGCNGIIRPYWIEDADGQPVTVIKSAKLNSRKTIFLY